MCATTGTASRLQHLIMPHPARRQISPAHVRQCRLGPRVLFGVVVFPFDRDGAVVADAVQLDHDLLNAVGVAGAAGGDEVPAVERMAHRAMPAQQARPRVLADDLHALDMSAVDVLAQLADELHDRHALPFHVRAVEVEADDAFIALLAHEVDVIARGLDVAHGSFARMAFEIERDTVLLARVPNRAEALGEQLQTDLPYIRDVVTFELRGQRREEEEMAPAVGRRADETRPSDFSIL